MLYRFAADTVLVVHFAFILFVLFGGFLALKWPRVVFLHLPCVAYGAAIEFIGWVCPLTPLENRFRRLAGSSGYEGGFIEEYLLPVIYPAHYTETLAMVLGTIVVVLNLGIYGYVGWRRHKT